MIIKTDQLKDVCSKILSAVDSNELSIITETLQLKYEVDSLFLIVTNKEYYVKVRLPLSNQEAFNATVNANLFLKLISQMTTADIELGIENNNLIVKGNGKYKLPLIFDNDKLLELPEIKIENVTSSLKISSEVLNSILQYNSKELLKGTISRPVQKLYYIDEKGAITFTSGACVNEFKLEKPIKILLNNRIVKLFKLFKDCDVEFDLGYDSISNDIVQTKVCFKTSNIQLTAILSCDDTLLNSVPVAAIRNRADTDYMYSVNLNKDALLQTISRLLLFTTDSEGRQTLKPYCNFQFAEDKLTIWDVNNVNNEIINYDNAVNIPELHYIATLDLIDLKATLDSCPQQYLTLRFGNKQAVVLIRGNIKNIIPEVSIV